MERQMRTVRTPYQRPSNPLGRDTKIFGTIAIARSSANHPVPAFGAGWPPTLVLLILHR